jgi:hypothetical protein
MAGPRGAEVTAPTQKAAASWSPTVVSLVVLIGLEIAAYAALRWAFRSAHGG